MKKLTDREIDPLLKRLSGWKKEDDIITKEWQFKDFKEAMIFINQIADLAEKQNHHPEINNVYNKVTLKLFTHFMGGLTEKDFNLAAEIDKL